MSMSKRKRTPIPILIEHCLCGNLAWTVEAYGRVTHKHYCPARADDCCQAHPKGCP